MWAKDMNTHLSEEDIQMTSTKKMFDIISNWGSASQNP